MCIRDREKLIDFQALGLELAGRVNDGETLEKKIDELRPDIVLTDISMPREDGLDAVSYTHLKSKRSREEYKK